MSPAHNSYNLRLTIPIGDVIDYSAINATSCFLSESAPNCCVNILVLQDSLKEVRERFTVQLQLDSDDTSITLGVSRATVFITDSSSECQLIVEAV